MPSTSKKKTTTRPSVLKSSKKNIKKNSAMSKIAKPLKVKSSPTVTKKIKPVVVKTTPPVRTTITKPQLPKFNEIFTKQTIILTAVVIVIALVYIYRGLFIAAMVNGQPIFRWQILSEAEKAQGTQVLDNLVLEALVEQKAREKGVQISDQLVDERIESIRQDVIAQGQDLEELLALQGMTMDDLQHQIRLQQTIEALVGSDIEVTQEEIDQYLEENQEFLPEGSTEEELNTMATEQLQQQKLSTEYQAWMDKTKAEAKLQYFGRYIQDEAPLE
jgi:parvulin-like peptidyl-prolyl isomerase